MKTAPAWIVSVFAMVAATLVASTIHGQAPIACKPAERPIPTEYRFDGDVVCEIREDRNFDGKMDTWRTFEQGRAKRHEYDRDFDGVAEWRHDWDLPADAKVEAVAIPIDGRYRILPSDPRYWVVAPVLPTYLRCQGRTSKLIDGHWVDTFEERMQFVPPPHYGPLGEETVPEPDPAQRVFWRYENGKPVRAVVDWPGRYELVEWKDGLPIRRERRDATVSSRSRYVDGAEELCEKFDPQGRLTERWNYVNGRQTIEKFINRSWRRTHPPTAPQVLTFHDHSELPKSRRTYDDDGGRVEEMIERDGTVVRRASFDNQGWPLGVQQLVNGQWTGNFIVDGLTYRDGRLVKVDHRKSIPGSTIEWPTPTTRIWKVDGLPGRRTEYDPTDRSRYRMLREELDLNNDDVPDVMADYERLTIEQPAVLPK